MERKIIGLSLELLPHPGETAKEIIKSKELSLLSISKELKIRHRDFKLFLNGKIILDDDELLRLDEVLEVEQGYFLRLSSFYKTHLENVLADENISKYEYKIVGEMNLMTTKKYLVEFEKFSTLNIVQKINWLRNYFNVSSLSELSFSNAKNVAFRSTRTEKFGLEKWLMILHLINSKKVHVKAISKLMKFDFIDQIREATFIRDFDEVLLKVEQILNDNGINFIHYEYNKNLGVQGFVTYKNDAIYLGVTTKGRYQDIFRFTLCHELSHLIIGNVNFKHSYIDDGEEEANLLAQNILIDENEYYEFIRNKEFTNESIYKLSTKIGVAPGIIVGRLQKENHIKFSDFNYMRKLT